MSDSYTTLNSGSGGDSTDMESITTYGSAPTTRKRHRMVIAGSAQAELAAVTNSAASATAYGLVVRALNERSSTVTSSTVASSATSVTLLASNSSRRGGMLRNDDTASILYVRFAASAATTSMPTRLTPQEIILIPYGYTGEIRGIWDVATGNCRVDEAT
mgnify:CR=1 FL=1